MNYIKVTLVTGLPGSGKTTLAKEMYRGQSERERRRCNLISLDDCKDRDLEEFVKIRTRYVDDYDHFIIEGLMLTNDAILKVLNGLKSHLSKNDKVDVTIHYFNEDRETCLYNDIGRRTQDARITIKHAKYEVPDSELIQAETGFSCKLEKHYVARKSNFETFCNLNNIYSGSLSSCSWSLGGTYGNCWDDHLSTITPDTPLDFTEFDELLEQICPNLTFLQYKKLERECTKVVETSSCDYYGGCEYHAHHECDLPKLYVMLEEMGYVNLEEQIQEYIKEMEEDEKEM